LLACEASFVTRILTWTAVAAIGAMTACDVARAPPADAGGPPLLIRAPITARYHCDDGTDFVAVFDRAAERATVRFADRPALILSQAVSGSGFRYSDGRHALRGKGDEALWIVDGEVRLRCRAEAGRR
jgi:membrane-bound inhibitor of C-type lysozyme